MAGEKGSTEESLEGPAEDILISLSQALLAPLDSIFKAQLHAARSFLNMLLQLGYPHQPVDEEGEPLKGGGGPVPAAGSPTDDRQKPYNLEFHNEIIIDGQVRRQKVSVPALALVPLAPLAVEAAEFKFGMTVRKIGRHRQIQESEEKKTQTEKDKGYDRHKRPWFLVDNPISVRGVIAAPQVQNDETKEGAQESMIQIEVKVGRILMPAGLEKLVTSLTQSTYVTEVPQKVTP